MPVLSWGCNIVQHYPFHRFRREGESRENYVPRLELIGRAGAAVARLLAGKSASLVESVVIDHEGLHIRAPLVRTCDDIETDIRACHEALERDVAAVIDDAAPMRVETMDGVPGEGVCIDPCGADGPVRHG